MTENWPLVSLLALTEGEMDQARRERIRGLARHLELLHASLARGLLSVGSSAFGWSATSFLGREIVFFFAGAMSSGAGPRPSQATFDPAIGASQVVPEAQQPASVIAASAQATYFGIISAPLSFSPCTLGVRILLANGRTKVPAVSPKPRRRS